MKHAMFKHALSNGTNAPVQCKAEGTCIAADGIESCKGSLRHVIVEMLL